MSEEGESNELPDLEEAGVDDSEKEGLTAVASEAPSGSSLDLVMDVPLRLSVELGSTQLAVREVLALTKGSVVELNRMSGDPADVYANDRLIARGELEVRGERVAVKITELVSVGHASGDH